MSNVKSQSNILVYARSRPILEHEELIGGENCVFSQNNCIRLQAGRYSCDSNDNSDSCDRNDNRDNHDNQDFIFDGGVFGQNSTQVEVYNQVAQPMIDTALSGVNVSIFAYGQSSAGKTYTVLGGENEHSGLLPRIVAGIFDRIQGFGEDQQVSVVFTYVELYNEQIRDLINKNNENLIIRESIEKGIYIQGVSEHILDSTEAFLLLLHKGNENRATSANQYNQNSSRSHAIATLHITRKDTIRNDIKKSQFHLIDLAGSERVQQNANCSETLIKETVKINQSLFTLGKVIKELTKVVQNNTSNSSSNNNSKKSQSPMISPQLSLSDTFPLSTMSPQYSHNQIPSRTPSPLNSSQQTKVEQKYVKDVKNNENNGKEGNNTGTLKSSGKSNNKDSSQSSTLHSISSNNKNNTNKTTKDSNKNCNKDCLSNFVSYRDSKLTRLLKESLGGNARTSIIICISSSSTYYSESLNSLRFGKAASQVKNSIHENKEITVEGLKLSLAKAHREISLLRLLNAQLIKNNYNNEGDDCNRQFGAQNKEDDNIIDEFSQCGKYTKENKQIIKEDNGEDIIVTAYPLKDEKGIWMEDDNQEEINLNSQQIQKNKLINSNNNQDINKIDNNNDDKIINEEITQFKHSCKDPNYYISKLSQFNTLLLPSNINSHSMEEQFELIKLQRQSLEQAQIQMSELMKDYQSIYSQISHMQNKLFESNTIRAQYEEGLAQSEEENLVLLQKLHEIENEKVKVDIKMEKFEEEYDSVCLNWKKCIEKIKDLQSQEFKNENENNYENIEDLEQMTLTENEQDNNVQDKQIDTINKVEIDEKEDIEQNKLLIEDQIDQQKEEREKNEIKVDVEYSEKQEEQNDLQDESQKNEINQLFCLNIKDKQLEDYKFEQKEDEIQKKFEVEKDDEQNQIIFEDQKEKKKEDYQINNQQEEQIEHYKLKVEEINKINDVSVIQDEEKQEQKDQGIKIDVEQKQENKQQEVYVQDQKEENKQNPDIVENAKIEINSNWDLFFSALEMDEEQVKNNQKNKTNNELKKRFKQKQNKKSKIDNNKINQINRNSNTLRTQNVLNKEQINKGVNNKNQKNKIKMNEQTNKDKKIFQQTMLNSKVINNSNNNLSSTMNINEKQKQKKVKIITPQSQIKNIQSNSYMFARQSQSALPLIRSSISPRNISKLQEEKNTNLVKAINKIKTPQPQYTSRSSSYSVIHNSKAENKQSVVNDVISSPVVAHSPSLCAGSEEL